MPKNEKAYAPLDGEKQLDFLLEAKTEGYASGAKSLTLDFMFKSHRGVRTLCRCK